VAEKEVEKRGRYGDRETARNGSNEYCVTACCPHPVASIPIPGHWWAQLAPSEK